MLLQEKNDIDIIKKQVLIILYAEKLENLVFKKEMRNS